jgi:DNA-binding NarL/FixJ family response regulator
VNSLPPRQAQVLWLIAEGKTNGEIADALVISLRTVERHVAELYAKIGVRNRVEAAAFAISQLVRA